MDGEPTQVDVLLGEDNIHVIIYLSIELLKESCITGLSIHILLIASLNVILVFHFIDSDQVVFIFVVLTLVCASFACASKLKENGLYRFGSKKHVFDVQLALTTRFNMWAKQRTCPNFPLNCGSNRERWFVIVELFSALSHTSPRTCSNKS